MAGTPERVKGHVKETVGNLTGNKELESEGKSDRRAGEVKEKVGDAKDKVEEVIEKGERKVGEVIDRSIGASTVRRGIADVSVNHSWPLASAPRR